MKTLSKFLLFTGWALLIICSILTVLLILGLSHLEDIGVFLLSWVVAIGFILGGNATKQRF